MTPEQWQRDIDVNLTGAFRTIQACLGGMRERRHGRIVVISSVAALGGLPGQVAYAASKAGQLGMVRTLAAENAARGITANAILPGLVATEQVLAMPEEVLQRAAGRCPADASSQPAEVAAAVAFLAGEEAAQVNGQVDRRRRRRLADAALARQRARLTRTAARGPSTARVRLARATNPAGSAHRRWEIPSRDRGDRIEHPLRLLRGRGANPGAWDVPIPPASERPTSPTKEKAATCDQTS